MSQPELISYRDSKRYPSDPLALRAWVRIAELAARQVVCRPFDACQFARALELCRRLTCKEGPEGIKRMIAACAGAGVAVVVAPNFDGCRVSSASQWLVEGRKAMIALSIRYRRDDQLYFSLFREAGAILAAVKTGSGTIGRNGPSGCCAPMVPDPVFHPDRFAREFLIPPEEDPELALLAADENLEAGILAFAKKLGIAPGLVGRMQHDGILTWKEHNRLKRRVDLSHVLGGAEAMEETWPDQSAATKQVMRDFGLNDAQARERIRRAAAGGAIMTNGRERRQMRIEPGQLAAWRLTMRDRDLDREDREDARAA